MTTHFTCPHCGQRASTDRTDVEWVDVGTGSDSLFPSLPPGEERHLDQRICCEGCYARHGRVRSAPGPDPAHPFGVRYHREVRLAHPVGERVGAPAVHKE